MILIILSIFLSVENKLAAIVTIGIIWIIFLVVYFMIEYKISKSYLEVIEKSVARIDKEF